MLFDVNRKRFKFPSWVIPALGYLVSAACLIWVLQGVDYATLLDDLRSLQWRWIIVGVVADIAVYIYQAWRWNILLSPVVKPPLWRSVQAIYVGLFSNEVLPFRPGELIRSYLQSHWSRIPFSVSLSSALLERVFDGIWLIIAFVAVTAQMAHGGLTMPHVMIEVAKFLGVVVAALAIGLGLIMFWKQHAHRAIPQTRWGQKLRVFIDDLHLMGQSRSFYWGALASLPYLLIQVIPIYALIRAYELDLGIGSAMVVLVIWRLGTVIPQAPGNVGASQALMVLALALFGVDKTTATGLSVVIWGVITLPLLLAGFAALALSGVKLGDLRAHAKKQAAAPAMVTQTPAK